MKIKEINIIGIDECGDTFTLKSMVRSCYVTEEAMKGMISEPNKSWFEKGKCNILIVDDDFSFPIDRSLFNPVKTIGASDSKNIIVIDSKSRNHFNEDIIYCKKSIIDKVIKLSQGKIIIDKNILDDYNHLSDDEMIAFCDHSYLKEGEFMILGSYFRATYLRYMIRHIVRGNIDHEKCGEKVFYDTVGITLEEYKDDYAYGKNILKGAYIIDSILKSSTLVPNTKVVDFAVLKNFVDSYTGKVELSWDDCYDMIHSKIENAMASDIVLNSNWNKSYIQIKCLLCYDSWLRNTICKSSSILAKCFKSYFKDTLRCTSDASVQSAVTFVFGENIPSGMYKIYEDYAVSTIKNNVFYTAFLKKHKLI